jgi:glycosyltransferase involved in cell wall biosynthesis
MKTGAKALLILPFLVRAPVLRMVLAAGGRQYAEKFPWQSTAQSYIAIYQQLVATHANRD